MAVAVCGCSARMQYAVMVIVQIYLKIEKRAASKQLLTVGAIPATMVPRQVATSTTLPLSVLLLQCFYILSLTSLLGCIERTKICADR